MRRPRTILLCFSLTCSALAAMSTRAEAQVVRFQQPIGETFSANTTVVIPDRGQSDLGSVSGGRTFSRRYGYPPGNYSRYSDSFRSSLSTSVYIHDFEAMDRAILNRPEDAPLLPYEESYRETSRRLRQAGTVARNPASRRLPARNR